MRSGLTVVGIGLVCVAAMGCLGPQRVVTTRTLLAEMTDLRSLAEYPDPPFRCAQFSSYDRRSTSPSQPEPPEEGWFANADFNQYLRVEERAGRKEYVMMDADGPGAIVRIWSANPKGTLRIYLDGSDQPALEAPMQELLGGKVPGIPAPIACERSMGWNSYLPIPYARHCKVTSDANEFYYHVNYRTYRAGTRVVSFDRRELDSLSDVTWAMAGRLAAARQGAQVTRAADALPVPAVRELKIGAGQLVRPVRIRTPGAITGLALRLRAADPVQALRHVVLTIDFDGEQTVECPVGDFFGAAPGINAYESLPAGVCEDGLMWCHWWMPFQRSARLGFRNLGDQEVVLTLDVDAARYQWTDRSMYFHARWRTESDMPTRPMRDWNYLIAQGQGVFAGVAFTIANPVRQWWGEGDEKIYVDGETFPSHFGTGTEDYYGYAWCCNRPFTHAYHSQPRCDGPDNYGHTAVNRWHILDRIPFEKDFRFDMELWHWRADVRVTSAVAAYWYARPGASDAFKPLEAADLQLRLLPKYVTFTVPGAIEGEKMRVIEKRDAARVDPHLQDGASGDQTLLYHHDTKVGDKLVLGFNVDQAGRYRLLARFLKSSDLGIVQWSVNAEQAGDPVDLYNPAPVLTDEIDLGPVTVGAGENRLTAEVVGTNEKSVKQRYRLGLDYIRLEPLP